MAARAKIAEIGARRGLVAGTNGAMAGACAPSSSRPSRSAAVLTSAYDPGSSGDGSGGSSSTGGNGAGGSGGASGGGTSTGNVTFYRDVMPILQKDCLSCHASGGAAQPVLDDAQSAIAAASTIEAAIQSKEMPPFPPAEGCNAYVGERRISAVDQQTIAQWVAGGAPAGDPMTAPPAMSGGGAQPLGTPDKHLAAGPFTPTYPGSAGPNNLYWCFVLDPQLGAASDLVAHEHRARAEGRSAPRHRLPRSGRAGLRGQAGDGLRVQRRAGRDAHGLGAGLAVRCSCRRASA